MTVNQTLGESSVEAKTGVSEEELANLLAAVGTALAASRGADRPGRVAAVEAAVLNGLAEAPAEHVLQVLDALEGRFPVRSSPAEEECAKLRLELQSEKERSAQLAAKVRGLEESLKRGAAEDVRLILEKLAGGSRAGLEDPKKLGAILEALGEHAQKTMNHANVALERWGFTDQQFPKKLEELVSAVIERPPQDIRDGVKRELERVRKLLKAIIRADLEYTPMWCDGAQTHFSRERFEQGGPRGKVWDRYLEFIEKYNFRTDLMQKLRNFIDEKRNE
jgi:hypothetical protein